MWRVVKVLVIHFLCKDVVERRAARLGETGLLSDMQLPALGVVVVVLGAKVTQLPFTFIL